MLFILDTNSLIHSYFHVRSNDDLYDVTERVLTRMERIRTHFQKLFLDCSFVAVFDNNKETFRHLIYDKYKANRTKHDDLPEIIQSVKEATHNDADWIDIEAPVLLEADDVIASLARQYPGKVIVHSNDKDLRTLLEDGRVLIIKRSWVDEAARELKYEFYNYRDFVNEYGFTPDRWLDFRAITGDDSDNLKDLSWRWAGDELAKRVIKLGCPLDNVPESDPTLAINKKQLSTYPEFRRNLALHFKLLRMRNDMQWPFELLHLKELEMV